jgi:hypothetical protein
MPTTLIQDPWVKQNFVLAYAHALKDGLGGQVSSIQLRCSGQGGAAATRLVQQRDSIAAAAVAGAGR